MGLESGIREPGSATLSRGTYLRASCGNDQVELLEEVRFLLATLLLVSHHLHLVSGNEQMVEYLIKKRLGDSLFPS